MPFRVPLPTVVTVHDLSVILFPNWHPADRVKRYEQAFARGIEAAAHILVDSDAVRSEAIRVLGLSPERVTTVHCGIAPAFQPQPPEAIAAVRSRLDLPVRYLLCVGTVEPRKNLTTLLRAFCDLPAALRESCPLVLGGSWGWRSEPERELFESERGTSASAISVMSPMKTCRAFMPAPEALFILRTTRASAFRR